VEFCSLKEVAEIKMGPDTSLPSPITGGYFRGVKFPGPKSDQSPQSGEKVKRAITVIPQIHSRRGA